jgi:Flp pilus assembly protein TadD
MTKDLLKQAQQLHRQGDLKQALSLYQQVLSTDSKNADLLHQIGIIYAQLEQYPEALLHIDAALAEQPSAGFYNSKGNVLLRLKAYDDALTAYRKAIKLNARYEIENNNIGI